MATMIYASWVHKVRDAAGKGDQDNCFLTMSANNVNRYHIDVEAASARGIAVCFPF
jgi:hypothetical protein